MTVEIVDEPYVYQDETVNEPEPTEGEPSEPTEEESGAEPEPAEPTGEDAPAEQPQEKEKGVQKRIDELTRKRREAEREAEYWKSKATGKEGATEPHREESVAIPVNFPAKPTVEQFGSYDDFVEAITDWKTDLKIAQREMTAEQKRVQSERQKVLQTHQERVTKAKEVYEDFEEVLEDANDIQMPEETLLAILESDKSADVLYHLAKNREQALKIAAMPTKRQLIEIGKIEERLEKATRPVKRTTKAPDPITPVGNQEKVQKSPDDMTDDEWLEYERKRLAKLGRLY